MKTCPRCALFLIAVGCVPGLAHADGLLDKLKKAVPAEIREGIERAKRSVGGKKAEPAPKNPDAPKPEDANNAGAAAPANTPAPAAVESQPLPNARPRSRNIRGEVQRCQQLLGPANPSPQQQEAFNKCMLDMQDRTEAINAQSAAASSPGAASNVGAVGAGGSDTLEVAYVANEMDKTVSQYVIGQGGLLTPMNPPSVLLRGGNVGMTIDPTGHHAYVSSGDQLEHCLIGPDGALTSVGSAIGTGFARLTINPANSRAYAAGPSNTLLEYVISQQGTIAVRGRMNAGRQPMSVAIDPSGQHAYVTNFDGVMQYTIGSDDSLMPMSPASVRAGKEPRAIAVDPSGRYVYVADYMSQEISQYQIGAGGALTPMIPSAVGAGQFPEKIAIHPSGRYVYVGGGGGELRQFTVSASGGLIPMNPPIVARHGVSSVSVEPTGRYVYTTSPRINKVWQYSVGANGELTELGSVATGEYPEAIATAFVHKSAVEPFTGGSAPVAAPVPSGPVVTDLAGSPRSTNRGFADGVGAAAVFSMPTDIAVDSGGNVLVVDRGNQRIRKISPTGETTTLTNPRGGRDNETLVTRGIRGIAVDLGDSVHLSSPCMVQRLTPEGVVRTLAGSEKCGGDMRDGSGRLAGPAAIAIYNGAGAFVIDGENAVGAISVFGGFRTFAGIQGTAGVGSTDGRGKEARFHTLTGIAVDSWGNVFVTDTGNKTVRKITTEGVVTTLAAAGGGWVNANGSPAPLFANPSAMAIDDADSLYVVDAGTVKKVTRTGAVTTVLDFTRDPGFAGVHELRGIAIHSHSIYLTINDGVVVVNNVL